MGTPFSLTNPDPVRATLGILVCCAILCAPQNLSAGDSQFAFWVWNRAEPLTAAEGAALGASGVHRLYWQVGELELHAGALSLRRTVAFSLADPAQARSEPPLEIIPVVRVSTLIRSPEQFSGEDLGNALRAIADAVPSRELQLDFDCPDRFLPLYAEHLRTARRIAGIRRLTITALESWANTALASPLWSTVDAVFPMLYDTRTDPVPTPGGPSPCRPRALLDPDALERSLQNWRRCPVPWYAGLPVFARITLYDDAGRSRGHLRGWDWEDVIFNPGLTLDRPRAGGTTVLRAKQATRIGESTVPRGGYVALRTAERQAIRSAITQANAANARGVVLFRLPDPPGPLRPGGGGWSLPQVLALLSPADRPPDAEPRLTFHRAEDGTQRWILRNDSECDLPPRFDSTGRGYGLELELADGTPGWREALPGDFHRVVGHVFSAPADAAAVSEDKPVAVAIPLARRLTFWFAELPAHGALSTGLVQLAPGLDATGVRFRVPAIDCPASSTWQTAH